MRRRMAGWLAGWPRDVRGSLRTLRGTPGFSAAAIATLGLGIGGSAAIFTVIQQVVLDPLPYPGADRLVRLQNLVPGVAPTAVWSLSTAQFVYFSDHASQLSQVGLYRRTGGNILTRSGPERVRGVGVTSSMMSLIGVSIAYGRALQPSDDAPSAPAVALASHGFWRRVLGADAAVVGTTLTYNDQPVTIVGVLAADVDPPGWSDTPDLWLPLRVDRAGPFHNNHVFPGIARLAPGATPATAAAELAGLTPQLPAAFPSAYSQAFLNRYGFRTDVVPLKDDVLGDLSRNLWMLFAGVGLVLIIAAANVANLFAVRMDGRRREMAIRAALGAGRAALVRCVLADCLTLSIAGALAAGVLSVWAVPALVRVAPADLPRIHDVSVGVGTVGFALGLAVLVACALALYPALVHAGSSALRHLYDATRSATAGRRSQRARGALVVLQIAVALTLAVGAGLLLATVARFRDLPLGLSPHGAVAVDVYLTSSDYPTDAAIWRFDRDLLQRVRALPGVTGAGMTEEIPIAGDFGCTVQGFDEPAVFDRLKAAGLTTCAGQEATTPGYFDALGIPVLEGRAFADADNDDPEHAAVIVSKAFADRFWPGERAIGKHVAPNGHTDGPYYRVVGVVGDVPASAGAGQMPLSRAAMAIYYPIRHDPAATWGSDWWPGDVTMVIGTRLEDPASIVPDLRRVVASIDPAVPLANVRTMDAVVGRATSQIAFVSVLLTIAAVVALLLAAVGLYGTMAYVVAQRTREIGMRLAIGASPAGVQRAIVMRSIALAGLGVPPGLALAYLATRALQSLIAGAGTTDPRLYAAAVTVLAVIAIGASWLPARRASRIDPAVALRAE